MSRARSTGTAGDLEEVQHRKNLHLTSQSRLHLLFEVHRKFTEAFKVVGFNDRRANPASAHAGLVGRHETPCKVPMPKVISTL
jgi:hypothetical protein